MRGRIALVVFMPLCALAVLLAAVRYVWCIVTGSPQGSQLAIAFDRLGNTAINGDPDETISSRAARARLAKRRWGCILCRLLDSLDSNHCNKSLETRFLKQSSPSKEQHP